MEKQAPSFSYRELKVMNIELEMASFKLKTVYFIVNNHFVLRISWNKYANETQSV